MSKILMLWPDVDEGIPQTISKNYHDLVTVKNLYKKCGLMGRICRKVRSKFNMSTSKYFDVWINDILCYEIIIIHANIINRSVPRIIRERKYEGRLIYWYWNPVKNCIDPTLINKKYCEIWSFDKEDSKVYNMNYNSTYYFSRIIDEKKKQGYGAYFLGKDKKRFATLDLLRNRLIKLGMNCNFLIIKDSNSEGKESQYSKAISYDENIQNITNSDVLVDIVQEGQKGLTLRVMESIFFNKKLLTNNYSIVNEEFYSPDYIYILGDEGDSDEKLNAFLNNNGFNWSKLDTYKDYYDFSNWIKRFGE